MKEIKARNSGVSGLVYDLFVNGVSAGICGVTKKYAMAWLKDEHCRDSSENRRFKSER